jgi:hypothetical protein
MAKYARDLSSYKKPEQREAYEQLFEETKNLFLERAESFTVVHSMIIDRFVSTYIDLISLDDIKAVSEQKYKMVQDKFQSWSKVIMESLNSVSLEAESRRTFFMRVKEIMTEEIPDDKLRKRIFERILEEAVKKK